LSSKILSPYEKLTIRPTHTLSLFAYDADTFINDEKAELVGALECWVIQGDLKQSTLDYINAH